MWNRFVLFGLCCILAVGYASSKELKELKLCSKLKAPKNESQSRMEISWDGEPQKGDNENMPQDEEGCYPKLGCFDLGEPWNSETRPLGAPENPNKIKTKISFFSRHNIPIPINIPIYPDIVMNGVHFEWNRKSVIIVHGFESIEKDTWMEDLKDAYLKQVDANIMIVDWGQKSFKFNYFQVVTSTRIVGRQLALFVEHLITHYQADPKRFHLIGHGLGAHICSYLAKEIPGIGRLTALDPAQPFFEGFPEEVRVDKSDARFVELIHTDALPFIPKFGFGMIAPYGHVDFYMNGGYDQPGCYTPPKMKFFIQNLRDMSKYTFATLSEWFHCSHARAYQYFISAINHTNECVFWGQKVKEKSVFLPKSEEEAEKFLEKLMPVPSTCTEHNCIKMGLRAHKTTLRGIFLVSTFTKYPYCAIIEGKENFFSSWMNDMLNVPFRLGHLIGIL